MSKPVSALSAASGKNLATVAGCHSLAETVDLRAMKLLRLISTNHYFTPPILVLVRKVKHLNTLIRYSVIKHYKTTHGKMSTVFLGKYIYDWFFACGVVNTDRNDGRKFVRRFGNADVYSVMP